MLHIDLNQTIPKFTLDKEGFLEKASVFVDFKDINTKNKDNFSDCFCLL